MERLPYPSDPGIRLDHLAGDLRLYSRHLDPGIHIVRGRALDAPGRSARRVAIAAGIFCGVGIFLASFSAGHLYWLYFSYGILAGIGLGLGYIDPVATLVKWFPDTRGTITGKAVAGFGAGALITGLIASRLIGSVGVMRTFAILGVVYFLGNHSLLCYAGPSRKLSTSRLGSQRN